MRGIWVNMLFLVAHASPLNNANSHKARQIGKFIFSLDAAFTRGRVNVQIVESRATYSFRISLAFFLCGCYP